MPPLAILLAGRIRSIAGGTALRSVPALFLIIALVWTAAAPVAAQGRWQQVENQPDCAVWNGNPGPQETVTWEGPCVGGKAHGRGEKIWRYWSDGAWKESRYTGGARNGRNHGPGAYVWASGNRYDGHWRDGLPNGLGVFLWANGTRYEGGWRRGKRHGRGVYILANGDRCEGRWRDGILLQGEGWQRGYLRACRYDGDRLIFSE